MGRIVDVRHALAGLKAGQDIVLHIKVLTMCFPGITGYFA